MQKDLLVLTDRAIGAKQGAALTYRLVLPPLVACDLHSLTDCAPRIWWAEKHGGKVYLKACLNDCRMYIRHTRNGERQFVAVSKIDTSTYFYRDRPTCPLEGIVDTDGNVGHWQVIELDQHQASLLAKRNIEVSPIVLSLDDAVRINRRVLRACWPNITAGVIYPKQLWRTFKRCAATSELVRVNGLDPYETSVAAALMDIGAAFSIGRILRAIYDTKKVIRPNSNSRNNTSTVPPAFIPLISKPRHYAFRRSPISTTSILLRDMSIEHERIVASLAYKLESMGLTPYVSPLVDVAVINDRSAVFFEAKTVNDGNLLDQLRSAIGQLLEYRFIYRYVFDCIHLVFVAPAVGSLTNLSFAEDFLSYCGIDWVVWLPGYSEFKFLEETLKRSCYGSSGTM